MSASFLRHLALCQICAATTATAFGAGMLWLATGHVPLTFAECVAWVRSKGIPQDARAGIGFDGSNVDWLNRVRALYRMAPVVVVEDRRVAA